MSELQLYLLAGGAVFVGAVYGYNVWTERRASRKAEDAFGERPPTRSSMTARGARAAATRATGARRGLASQPPSAARRGGGARSAAGRGEISSRIDTVA
jgi:hypothetical protein